MDDRDLMLQQLMEKVQELEANQARSDERMKSVFSHISEIHKSRSIEETLETPSSLAQNTLETENAEVYCVDSRTDRLLTIQNGELQNVNSSDVIQSVKENQEVIIQGDRTYIPVMDNEDRVMGVVVADNAQEIDDAKIKKFQSEGDIGSVFKLAFSKEREAQTARTDQLTRIENRVGMEQYAERKLVKNLNLEDPAHIVMIDIDKFKNFNDTYGHSAGDTVLKSTATLLEDNLRDSDRVFRFGGEEMIIVMNGISSGDANKKADSLRQLIADTPVDIGDGKKVAVTVSMGVAQIPFDNISKDSIHKIFKETMDEADKRLYEAKEAGRNRVVGAPEAASEKDRRNEIEAEKAVSSFDMDSFLDKINTESDTQDMFDKINAETPSYPETQAFLNSKWDVKEPQHFVFDLNGRNDFIDKADLFKATNKESYSVYACIAPIGTKFENPLEKAEYETKDENTVILSGTQGEMWMTNKDRVGATYQKDGELIKFAELTKHCGRENGKCMGWTEIQTMQQPNGSVYAMQLGDNQTATVETSWATLEGSPGGFIVCDAGDDSKPNLESLRIIDENVFMKTHNLENFPELKEKAQNMDLNTPKPEVNFMPDRYDKAITVAEYRDIANHRGYQSADAHALVALKLEDGEYLDANFPGTRFNGHFSPQDLYADMHTNISAISGSVTQTHENSYNRYENTTLDVPSEEENNGAEHDGLD